MDSAKAVKTYSNLYKSALEQNGVPEIDAKIAAFERRLSEMYASEDFRRFNIYPTINVYQVFAVIAMCLEMLEHGFSEGEIIAFINDVFRRKKQLFGRLEKVIDALPCCYSVAKKLNISDHESRVKDGSITYDFFNVEDGKIEYSISKCKYVEIFEHYGIRRLCKVFCESDTQAYANLTKHVKFIRHSDLSDGGACHDEIIRIK